MKCGGNTITSSIISLLPVVMIDSPTSPAPLTGCTKMRFSMLLSGLKKYLPVSVFPHKKHVPLVGRQYERKHALDAAGGRGHHVLAAAAPANCYIFVLRDNALGNTSMSTNHL